MKWFVLALAIVMYALVISFKNKKLYFTSAAALLILILGMLAPGKIFPLPEDVIALDNTMSMHTFALTHAFEDIINWNVILIYLGSMILASLFIYSKVPVRLADSGLAMLTLFAMTGILSMFIQSLTALVLMTPIALQLCKKRNKNPAPFIIGLTVVSNLEGAATLLGSPHSMIFAGYAGFSFNDFFFHSGKPSVFFIIQAVFIIACLFFYFIFTRGVEEKVEIEKTPVVSYFPLFLLVAMIAGLVVLSFIHTPFTCLSGAFVVALGLLGLVWYRFFQKQNSNTTYTLMRELDWESIFFLAGLFIVIGAVKATGLLNDFALFLSSVTAGSKLSIFLIIILLSVVISGFVDNIPYMIAMLTVADSLAQAIGASPELYTLALLIGTCLGGNLTPLGSSANIVSMGIMKKEGYQIKFSDWFKIGLPFTLLTTGTAAMLLWLLWA